MALGKPSFLYQVMSVNLDLGDDLDVQLQEFPILGCMPLERVLVNLIRQVGEFSGHNERIGGVGACRRSIASREEP
jgi:hypothetical protein